MDLSKLGKKVYIVPLAIIVVLSCLFALIFVPMLQAQPKHVPFAVVSLDEGGTTIAGSTNVGETMAETLTEGDGLGAIGEEEGAVDESMSDIISWTVLDSEEAVREAIANNEYYGALIIPKDFTSAQMASMVGLGEAPELTLVLNVGKNATLANSIQMTLSQAMLKAGVALDVEEANTADIGGGMMASMIAAQFMVMPLFLLSFIPSILVSLLLWPRGAHTDKKQKTKRLGLQIAYILALSLLNTLCVLFITITLSGLTLPFADMLWFMWFASACLMLAIVGLCNLSLPAGVLIAFLVFGFGMSTVMLAPEMLPEFWANWICPWIPQYHIGQGIRSIIYFKTTPAFADLVPLLVMALVGLVSMLIAWALPAKKEQRSTAGLGTVG